MTRRSTGGAGRAPGLRLAPGPAGALALALVLVACDAGAGEWSPEAALAVAERARAGARDRCLVVSRGVGPALAEPMPFGVYQGLITSGFLVDSLVAAADTGVVVLGFRDAVRDGSDWTLETSRAVALPGAPARARADRVRWRVSCQERECVVLDSALVASGEIGVDGARGPVEGCPR